MSLSSTDRRLIAVVVVILGALILLPLLGMGAGMMGYSPMGGGMWGGGGGMWGGQGQGFGWVAIVAVVMQLLFLAAIVLAGYLVYRALTRRDGRDRALEELRLAYARGDLTDEEFEQRREALREES